MLIKGVKSPSGKQINFLIDFFHLFTAFKKKIVPTSQSPISKISRYLESLGKSNGKKWSQIVKLLLIKGVELSRNEFFVICATIRIGQELLCLPYAGFFKDDFSYMT